VDCNSPFLARVAENQRYSIIAACTDIILLEEEPDLRIKKWSMVVVVSALLIGCSPKEKPSPTLVPTLNLPSSTATPTESPTATATPTATPLPTHTPTPTATPIPLAAIVNGQPILLEEFEREVSRAGGAVPPEAVLEAMIETVLLEQAAASAGIAVSDEELGELIQTDIDAVGGRATFEERLQNNGMTEEEYREKVRSSLIAQRLQMQVAQEVPDTLEHVHARHILVDTREEAEAILTQLREGADFGTLAQTYSQDVSTRDRGGDLGFFARGLLLVPELEDAAFALDLAQISDVVQSSLLGFHIIQVLEKEERPLDKLDAELIRANHIRLWREQLWANASVERLIEP